MICEFQVYRHQVYRELPLRYAVQDLSCTDPTQETCPTAVDHAEYTKPSRQHALQQILQIRELSSPKYVGTSMCKSMNWPLCDCIYKERKLANAGLTNVSIS